MLIKTQPSGHDNCGLFAVMRKKDSPKATKETALQGICTAARRRGTKWGTGFAVFNAPVYDLGRFKAKVLAENRTALEQFKTELRTRDISIAQDGEATQSEPDYLLWEGLLNAPKDMLLRAVREVHFAMHSDHIRARLISLGQFSEVWKGIGWPEEIADRYGMSQDGDLWLCHSRMPTNFLGDSIRAHPFHLLDIGIIHNGEDVADGAHSASLAGHGERSFVGPDSEKIMLAVQHLVHVVGLSFEKAIAVLAPPPEKHWDKVVFQDGTANLRELVYRNRWARLDGSYAVIMGYTDGDDVCMAAVVDRRPLVMGEDNNSVYLASEASQITEISPDAEIWRCQPHRRLLATLNNGIIRDGRGMERRYFFHRSSRVLEENPSAIDVRRLGALATVAAITAARATSNRVTITGASGKRYLGMHTPDGTILEIDDPMVGDCLANLTPPNRVVHVRGSAQDDLGDASQAEIIVDEDVGENPLTSYQGRLALIRGSGGSRSMLLMRGEIGNEPMAVWGGRLDEYAGEFMGSGTAVVLGVNALNATDYDRPLVGPSAMTGAVGNSRMYVRGKVPFENIGLLPDPQEVTGELEQAVHEGLLDENLCRRVIAETTLTWWELQPQLPKAVLDRIAPLFFHHYLKRLEVEHKQLNAENGDARVVEGILAFGRQFDIPEETIRRLLEVKYTVIYPAKDAEPKSH